MSEQDNRPAWTGRPGAHEVWFLTATDPQSGAGIWLRWVLTAPRAGVPSGSVWFARFDPANPERTFGVHRRYPFDSVRLRDDEFEVRIGDACLRSGAAQGSLEGAGHRVRWELTFPTGSDTYRPLPHALYRGRLAPTRSLAPNVETRVAGTVDVDGEPLSLREAPAHQGHLHGSRHPERWAWAHCSDFDDEDVVVHAVTAQWRRGALLAPYLTTVGVRWEGRWIRLTKVGRSRDFGLGSWRVDVGNRRYRLTGRVEAPASAMVRARYDDPSGSVRWCHNSEIASSRLALFERKAGGFEEVALLESRGTTHAEWAGRTPATAVTREHVEVSE